MSNSTPLINLARIGRSDLLKRCFERVYIAPAVFEEVIVEGKRQGRKEVAVLEELISEGFIEVKKPGTQLAKIASLHLGENESISLCKEISADCIIVDDREAVEAAKLLGLKPMRTTALMLFCLKQGAIDFDELQNLLLMLSEGGYFLDAKTYEEILRAARKISSAKR